MKTSSTRQAKHAGNKTPEELMLICSQLLELSFLKEKP